MTKPTLPPLNEKPLVTPKRLGLGAAIAGAVAAAVAANNPEWGPWAQAAADVVTAILSLF